MNERTAARANLRLRAWGFTRLLSWRTVMPRTCRVCWLSAPAFSDPLLDDPQQEEDDHDEQDQADPPARVVAPAAAVRPRGSRPDEQENQDDEQDETHTALLFDLSLNVVGGIVIRVSRGGQLNSTRAGKERTSVSEI